MGELGVVLFSRGVCVCHHNDIGESTRGAPSSGGGG